MASNDIRKNTVSAEGQMRLSSEISTLGREDASVRVLVLGNSITRHGPNEEIGWPNDWGMAASAPEKDYVHRLYRKLTEAGMDVYMRIRQASVWEMHGHEWTDLSAYAEERDFGADVIVFRLGENVVRGQIEGFGARTEALLSYLNTRGAHVILAPCFWPCEAVDAQTREVARSCGYTLTELCQLSSDERTMALGLFEHSGVAMHPGDYGMDCIAELIAAAILQGGKGNA